MRIGGITIEREKLIKYGVFFVACMVAGYHGASYAQAKKDLRVCEAEMEQCVMEWTPLYGFEVLGKGAKK